MEEKIVEKGSNDITTIRNYTEKETIYKERTGIYHSFIWGTVVVTIITLVYYIIRFGKCPC